MGQKVFIPVTDEILYERPELITSPLMPFQVDQPCFRWLSAEIEAVDPASVDIDTTVELELTTTAMNFSPVHENHSPIPEILSEASLSDSQNHPYQPIQHVLRRRAALPQPCKDAA
ncbi:MAG: hypothetical protein KTR18_12160 [Acidiferrobacterales bacterium]|nr:hypothetical protein [Acidiferrobacterales bacterium]